MSEERFWQKVDKRGPDECWPWTACTDRGGYGMFRVDGRMVRAHRYSLALVEPLIDGLHVDHLCRVRACVNPRHMEQVTKTENNRRAGAAQTHCVHGHEYTPENTYVGRDGHRRCRTCRLRDNDRARRARTTTTTTTRSNR